LALCRLDFIDYDLHVGSADGNIKVASEHRWSILLAA
jgi:hypothetical protein